MIVFLMPLFLAYFSSILLSTLRLYIHTHYLRCTSYVYEWFALSRQSELGKGLFRCDTNCIRNIVYIHMSLACCCIRRVNCLDGNAVQCNLSERILNIYRFRIYRLCIYMLYNFMS